MSGYKSIEGPSGIDSAVGESSVESDHTNDVLEGLA